MEENKEKLLFIMGAGAENGLGISTGAEFTLNTYIKKNKNVRSFMNMFYLNNKFVKNPKRLPISNMESSYVCWKKLVRRSLITGLKLNIEDNNDNFYVNLRSTYPHCVNSYKNSDLYSFRDNFFKAIVKDISKNIGKIVESINVRYRTGYKISSDDISDITKLIIDADSEDSELQQKFDTLFKEIAEGEKEDYSLISIIIVDNLEYYGIMEQKFNTILNPNKNLNEFYNLIYYFWVCFDVIIKDFMKVYNVPGHYFTKKKVSYLKDNVNYDFNHLKSMLKYLYKDASKELNSIIVKDEEGNNTDETLEDKIRTSYYGLIKKLDDQYDINIATTNYTPFIPMAGFKKVCWLAGRLDWFEVLDELNYYDIYSLKDKYQSGKFIFPYMMTQAPIKPIICSKQVREYSKFISRLSSTNKIFVIGYSLCENDSHIVSMIRERLLSKNDVKLYFFAYQNNITLKKINEILKLPNEILINRVEIVGFDESNFESTLMCLI